jgi:hypothetical protein
MTATRTADTGAEIRAVELWNDYGGVPVRQQAQPPGDNDAWTLAGLPVNARLQALTGLNFDRLRAAGTFKPVQLASGTAETAVWTPAAGRKFRLLRLVLTASAQTVLSFKDGTGGTLVAVVELPANQCVSVDLSNGILSAAANNILTVTRSVAATLNGTLMGAEE